VHQAARLAIILGQPGVRARSKRPSEPRVFAYQFQRTGVILTRSAFLLFGMATPVLSVEEGQRTLVASLKSFRQTRRGMVG
jgi:hypothetical protein